MAGRDLLRIGVLLIGISSIVLAILAAHFYFNILIREARPPVQAPFHVYCDQGVVVISARSPLSGVIVMDANRTVICSFDEVPEGSDEICRVGEDGIYLVVAGGRKRAVVCRSPPEVVTVRPAPGD